MGDKLQCEWTVLNGLQEEGWRILSVRLLQFFVEIHPHFHTREKQKPGQNIAEISRASFEEAQRIFLF
jgi:hypothetical protein